MKKPEIAKTEVELEKSYTSSASMALDEVQFRTYPDVIMRTEPSPRDWLLKAKILEVATHPRTAGYSSYRLTMKVEVMGKPANIRMWHDEWNKRYNAPLAESDSTKLKRRLEETRRGKDASQTAAAAKHKAAR